MSKLYTVRKIFDLRTNKKIDETVMCGQAAVAYVPSKKHMKLHELAKSDKKSANRMAEEMTMEDLWTRQKSLKPILGWPIYFSSVKMDAGWYRTSRVQKVELQPDGSLHVTTDGKILEIKEDE